MLIQYTRLFIAWTVLHAVLSTKCIRYKANVDMKTSELIQTVWYSELIQTVWYFELIQIVWYFKLIQFGTLS